MLRLAAAPCRRKHKEKNRDFQPLPSIFFQNVEKFFRTPTAQQPSLVPQKPTKIKLSSTRIALGGAVLYLLYHAYKLKAVGNLNFYPGTVQSIDFIGSSPYITFSVQVQNTASVQVVINSLAGNLFSNDTTLLGNVFTPDPVIVPAGGQAVFSLTAQLGLLGIVNDIIRAFQYKSFQEKISFQGTANVGGLQVPLDLKFTIGA